MAHDSTAPLREGSRPRKGPSRTAEPTGVTLGQRQEGGHKPGSPHGSEATGRFIIREKSKITPSLTQSLSAVQQHPVQTIRVSRLKAPLPQNSPDAQPWRTTELKSLSLLK